MDKEKVLLFITEVASQNLATKEEVVKAFEKGKGESAVLNQNVGLSGILYFVGGFIVFIGVSILVSENWTLLGAFGRIFSTLGFAIMAYFIGVLLHKEERFGGVSYAFHLIAGLVFPIGLMALFDELHLNVNWDWTVSQISMILLALYLASSYVFKKPIFTFFSIIFSSWLFFSITNLMVSSNPMLMDMKFHEYRLLIVGVSYIALGYHLSFTNDHKLAGPLYGFGSLFALGAGLALGGWSPSQNMIWEVIYPAFISAALYLSVHLKSKSFLTFATIFLMAYILKITGEYFSNTIGWPFSLMICGIALIGVGYYAFTLNKKYISSN